MQSMPDPALTGTLSSTARNARGRSATYVAERVRDMILAGDLPPGERISERMLTEGLGVTRTPLREAFKILETEGLLHIVPNRGAQVSKLSPRDVDMAMELLAGLESAAAELACERGTVEQFDLVEALHQRMVTCQREGDLMGYFRINQEIHQHIIDCAHNPALSRVYQAESARVRLYRFAGNRVSERWARAVMEHEQILAALKQRQGPLLREVLRAHHLNGWRVTRLVLENELQPDL